MTLMIYNRNMAETVVSEIGASFDQALYNSKAAHPMQSWQWGEARRKLKTHIIRLGEYENGSLINVFQLTLHPIGGGFSIGYLPRSVYPSQTVFDYLRQLGKKEKLVFIKIEPYEKAGRSIPADAHKSPHGLFPDWTQMLDLTRTEEEILKQMKSKTRYNIRLAEKKGVTVREETGGQGYEVFERLYFETCKRQHYFGHTPDYHRIIFQTLREAGIAHILTAYYNNSPLASYELFLFGDTFYYPYGGSSELYRNLMPANLLMWEAIKLGKKLGAKRFDMWGSLPPDYSHADPWAGFTRFKEGYGTEFVRMISSFDLVINPLLYRVYSLAYRLRKGYLVLRKSL